MSNYVKNCNGLAVPPLSEIGLGRGIWPFQRVVFGGKKHAFTLAEVLITLVIIGIVAALTIPNLLQKYQEQATVKKVQKFYSTLSNAYALAMKENGPASEWNLAGNRESAIKVYELLFKPYFKISKNCGVNNTGNCISNVKYKLLNNNDSGYYGSSTIRYKIALDDGATVFWKGMSENGNIDVYYDINGVKEPNTWGRDIFSFIVKNDKVIPCGIQSGNYSIYQFNNNCKNITTTGYGCTAWLIYKGNMDYLHCDGLTWQSRSCKDK